MYYRYIEVWQQKLPLEIQYGNRLMPMCFYGWIQMQYICRALIFTVCSTVYVVYMVYVKTGDSRVSLITLLVLLITWLPSYARTQTES